MSDEPNEPIQPAPGESSAQHQVIGGGVTSPKPPFGKGTLEKPDLGSHPPIHRKIAAFRLEGQLMLGVGVFFAVVGSVFTAFSGQYPSQQPTGAALLLTCAIWGFLPGAFLIYWSKRTNPRQQDRPDGLYSAETGPLGAFPDGSLWPLVLGAGATFVVLGMVYGAWTAVVGVSMMISSLVGVVVEGRRGGAV